MSVFVLRGLGNVCKDASQAASYGNTAGNVASLIDEDLGSSIKDGASYASAGAQGCSQVDRLTQSLSSGGGGSKICIPGLSAACACGGSIIGTKACAKDGRSWGACSCPKPVVVQVVAKPAAKPVVKKAAPKPKPKLKPKPAPKPKAKAAPAPTASPLPYVFGAAALVSVFLWAKP